MDDYHLERLLSRDEIEAIVRRLSEEIARDYGHRELVLICILKGAFMFLSDLIRHLPFSVQIDFVRLKSYGAGMRSSGVIEITKDVEIDLEGKDVLIVEDIIDSGRTIQFLKDRLAIANPRSIKVCALLDKKARREVEASADYLGADVEDVFVVGYGIDFKESYRNLPEIYYVTPLRA